MRTLLTLALMFLAVQPQQVITARRRAPSGTCTPPAFDHSFPVFNPANTCGVGIACTNGAVAHTQNDTVGSVAATNNGGVATYAANIANGQPAWDFGSGDQFNLSPGITVPSTITLAWVGTPADDVGSYPIVGNIAGSLSIEWRISAGHQQLINAGTALLVTGSATISTSGISTLYATWDGTTATVGSCVGGVCTPDTSATPGPQILTNPIDTFGDSGGDTEFQGKTLEWDEGAGFVSTADIATWSLCKYGH